MKKSWTKINMQTMQTHVVIGICNYFLKFCEGVYVDPYGVETGIFQQHFIGLIN